MFERRLKIFLGILSTVVLLLLARAAQLQVAQGGEWRKKANDTLKKVSYVDTSRGSILDRLGRELARDRACTDACVSYYALTPQADPTWLSSLAVKRLRARVADAYGHANKAEQKQMVKAEMQAIQADIDAMWGKLARISGTPLDTIESVRQSIFQRVEMRKKYIWYQSYLHATNSPGGTSELEPRWQKWLSGQTEDAPEIDKFAVTVGEEKQVHVILHDINLDVQNELGRHPEQYPGLVLRPGQTRYYPYGDVACHILGRIGKVSKPDMSADPHPEDPRRSYLPNDDIGRAGLELLGEPTLRGVLGSVVSNYGSDDALEPPVPGQNLRAAIDVDLQREIQKFFADATLKVKTTGADGETIVTDVPHQVIHGAAVLLDVKTNQVLALISYPTYDLNRFDEDFQRLHDDDIDAPLRNRATESQYEPGSTVKPLVGLSGITAGVVKVNEGIECTGYLQLPDHRSGKMIKFGHTGRCWVASTYAEILHGNVAHHQVPYLWPHHGHDGNADGFLTYSDGLERSCNVYFETVADRLGIVALSDWMRRFGLGRYTGIGIEEFRGRVPAEAPDTFGLQRRTTGFLGGIGQSFVRATPIQMANVAATIARGGIWMRPQLVMPDSRTNEMPDLRLKDLDGPDRLDLHLDPEALKACRLGMINVVNSKGGTGQMAYMDDLLVAGKTGTAQATPFHVVERDPVTHKVLHDEDGKPIYRTFTPSTPEVPNPIVPWYHGTGTEDKQVVDHSWMIGFAPADEPKVAYCVLVEYGGSGGGAAADVVRMALNRASNTDTSPGELPRRPPGPPMTEPAQPARPAAVFERPSMTQDSATTAPPPAPPRDLSARARRRAWSDPHVRFWWLSSLVLIAAAAYLLVSRSLNWRQDSRLSVSGTQVQATVLQADESVARGKTVSGDKSVRLSFEFGGKQYEVSAAYLEGRRSEEFIEVGSTIPIRVDPNDPSHWTPRDKPAPLAPELIGGAITLPIGLLIFLFSYWMRSRVLRTWREGKAIGAVVLAARHTALAPSAWSVRCTPAQEGDDRILEVFAPVNADVSEGALIWLLAPATGRAVAAAWFE